MGAGLRITSPISTGTVNALAARRSRSPLPIPPRRPAAAWRLAVLTDDEIELLMDAPATERGHLLWAAACRRYDLIGEFAEEVVRERFLLLTATLGYEDFDSFVRGKALWHSEPAELKGSTLRKLSSNVFRMLNEAGLLSDGGHLLRAVFSPRVASALAARNPSDLRFYPANNDATGRAVL